MSIRSARLRARGVPFMGDTSDGNVPGASSGNISNNYSSPRARYNGVGVSNSSGLPDLASIHPIVSSSWSDSRAKRRAKDTRVGSAPKRPKLADMLSLEVANPYNAHRMRDTLRVGPELREEGSSSSSSKSSAPLLASTSASQAASQPAPVQASAVEVERVAKAAGSAPQQQQPQDVPPRSVSARTAAVDSPKVDKAKTEAHTKPAPHAATSGLAPAAPAPVESLPVKNEAGQPQPAPGQDAPVPAPVLPRSSPERARVPPAAQTAFPPLNSRSAEFWYPDGNIIVKVEGTYFNLLRSRLERHCGFFARVFANRGWTNVRGKKVVELRDVKLQDFALFLKYLEVPMEHSVKEASKDTAMSLLRASRSLSCNVIGDLAEKQAFGPWSKAGIPAPGDELVGLPYNEAIQILALARELNVPLAQKHALYALLASDHFWSDAASKRADVRLSDADLLLLYRARALLQEKWRVLALTPPTPCHCQAEGCLRDKGPRNALWWGQMATYATTEVRDPLRSVEGVRTAVEALNNTWCRACVDERALAWAAAREAWWTELDQLFGNAGPEAQA